MDIAVISLASVPGRWELVRDQFTAAGLRAVRHDAVDGNTLTHVDIARLYDPALNRLQHHKPLRPGEIGCYASHLSLWRRLVASGERALAVFEDDIEVGAGLGGVLDGIARLPPDWDLVKLFGREPERVRQTRRWLPGTDLIRYRRVPSHTCAYAISRRGARKLLASRQPFGRPVDVDLRHWWENDLSIFGVQPYPVRLGPCSRLSTIDASRHGVSSPAMRARKLLLQARYTLLNWRAVDRQSPASTPEPAATAAVRRDVG